MTRSIDLLSRRTLLGLGLVMPFSPISRAVATDRVRSMRDGYRLVFADEFDDTDVGRINENATGGRSGAPAWRSRYRHPRKDVINKEKQIYMDVAFPGTSSQALGVQPFRIADSLLHITANRADPLLVRPYIWNFEYTSGCITTEYTHAQRYGLIEIRAKLPRGRGLWPALWLVSTKDTWPPELDILEGSGDRPGHFWNNVIPPRPHTPAQSPSPLPLPGQWLAAGRDLTENFHVYAMEWTPERITFYLDGIAVSEARDHGVHENMFLQINLAMGSHDPSWIPDPDGTTPLPAVLSVDYVRCYTRVT